MDDSRRLALLTAQIVSAFLEANRVSLHEVGPLIQRVHDALQLETRPPSAPDGEARGASRAEIRRSITPDALISFEDGRPYKLLRRHLGRYGLTPEAYRAKWGLPEDYPMTAANYSARRSTMAKTIGLGVRHGKSSPAGKRRK